MENPKKKKVTEHNGYPAEHNGYPAEHNGYPGLTGVGARDTCVSKKRDRQGAPNDLDCC